MQIKHKTAGQAGKILAKNFSSLLKKIPGWQPTHPLEDTFW